jgi:LysM repeat protein
MMYSFLMVIFSALSLGNQAKAELPKKPIQKIQVKEGQTAYSIAKEYGLTLSQLHRYNNFDPKADYLVTGSWVYLQKNSALRGTSPDKQLNQGE